MLGVFGGEVLGDDQPVGLRVVRGAGADLAESGVGAGDGGAGAVALGGDAGDEVDQPLDQVDGSQALLEAAEGGEVGQQVLPLVGGAAVLLLGVRLCVGASSPAARRPAQPDGGVAGGSSSSGGRRRASGRGTG